MVGDAPSASTNVSHQLQAFPKGSKQQCCTGRYPHAAGASLWLQRRCAAAASCTHICRHLRLLHMGHQPQGHGSKQWQACLPAPILVKCPSLARIRGHAALDCVPQHTSEGRQPREASSPDEQHAEADDSHKQAKLPNGCGQHGQRLLQGGVFCLGHDQGHGLAILGVEAHRNDQHAARTLADLQRGAQLLRILLHVYALQTLGSWPEVKGGNCRIQTERNRKTCFQGQNMQLPLTQCGWGITTALQGSKLSPPGGPLCRQGAV